MNSHEEYKNLLSKTYEEAIEYLLQKYGSVTDDFFRERSYERFMDGEIKGVNPVKSSKTAEGLYRHHIDEIKELKLSDIHFVKYNNLPFKYQKKERLVYCDLIEHAILHTLIAKETSLMFGFPGLNTYLLPPILDWYILEEVPEKIWQKHFYNKSYLSPSDAFRILKELHLIIIRIPVDDKRIDIITKSNIILFKQLEIVIDIIDSNNVDELYKCFQKRKEEKLKQKAEREERERREREYFINKNIEEAKLLHDKSPRIDIVRTAYFLKTLIEDEKDDYTSYEEFDSKMKKHIKDKILVDIKMYLNSLESSTN